mgnify:CR=1 FL=1
MAIFGRFTERAQRALAAAQRAAAENRKPSFQMVIDDVYAIGKGRLVGRPRY